MAYLPDHGEIRRYWRGCHCDLCRTACADYARTARAAAVEELGGRPATSTNRRWALTAEGLAVIGDGQPQEESVYAELVAVPLLTDAGLAEIARRNREGR